MKDLRIIIVSWNVRDLLERCFISLEPACKGLDWEVVIVDNASSDGSAETLKSLLKDHPRLKVVQNSDNRGFAKACNQGLSNLDARYVLLLNPDTECPPDSLANLVREADAHPEAGILGPRILNADGSHQASVRRFPTVWSQAGIMLKLHHVFPHLKTFRRYFAEDIDSDRAHEVDQVMGACFLIRREVIEELGGLDERYFIWFEEVDFCKQAVKKGWTVRYVPSVTVTHRGGASFGQVFSYKKQKYFNDSLIKYFRKWHSGWQAGLLYALQPASLALSWVVGHLVSRGSPVASRLTWKPWILFIIALETTSALTIFNDNWNAIATIVVGCAVGILAYKRPTLALSILLLELMIGSKGQLLQLWGWPGTWSLRIVIFLAFLLGWFFHAWEQKSLQSIPHLFRDKKEWLILFIIVAYATLRGDYLGNEFVGADGNSWGFLLLLFPVLDLASRKAAELRRDIIPVLFVAPIWLAVKTIGLEYLFSHGFPSISPEAYLWVRRTGVGEVTLVVGNAFRIFMQSYIFALPILLLALSYGLYARKKNAIMNYMIIASFLVLGISLSRSLWIGCFVGFVTLAWFYRKSLVSSGALFTRTIGLGIASLAIIFATLAFPIPRVDVASLKDLFGSRVSALDAAAISRWSLFPVVVDKIKEHTLLGSGFGATVTYKTSDPRILATNPDGMYTTYAFEWGWLEHWVKFGLFGFVLMIYLVFSIGRRILSSKESDWIRYGVFASLISIAAVHVFSPYLNHPLGFAFLFLAEGYIATSKRMIRHS